MSSSSNPGDSGTPKAKPKRPHSDRHGSSWIARLHRRHDAKHHAEQQPLLADDRLDEDTEAQEEAAAPLSRFGKMKSVLTGLLERLKHLLATCADKAKQGAKTVYNATRRNIRQILLAVILALITLLLALGLGWFTHHKGHANKALCTSAPCIHAASEILYSLSPNYADIDPCEHFDVLACQGFEDRHDLRPDQGDMFRGTIMAEDAEVTLRHILETEVSEIPSGDRDNFAKLKADYAACMDETTIESKGLKPLTEITNQIKSIYFVSGSGQSWRNSPVLQTPTGLVSAAGNEFTDAFTYLLRLGVDALVSVGIGADDKYPETQAVFVTPPYSIGLPSKEYYKDNKTVASYQEVVEAVLPAFVDVSDNETLWSARQRTTSIAGLAQGIIELEKSLADATPPEEDLNDITKSYNNMSLAQAKDVLPQLSLDKVISELAPSDYSAKSLIVASPSYLKSVSKLMNDTPKDVLQGFLIWKTIQAYSSRIEDPALKALQRFNNKMQGKEPDAKPERWRRCIGAADSDLGWILSKFFVDKAFSPEAKKFGDQIVSDIKGSFVAFLKDASWMTPDNRERAMTKVHAIDQKIGYPTSNPDIMDPAALKKYYKSVSISNDTFFENSVQTTKFAVKEEWAKLGKPTRHDEWGMTVPTVNAYYNPAGNEIVFPAGIMQSPVFYDPSVPQYLSYGAFGAVSGHELSHAFDNTGSQYDETGKFIDWWSNKTRKAFEKKTECFVDQYAEYSVTGPGGQELHVNGKLTLGENVADAGGIHAAFRAWKKRDAEAPGKLLPGLESFTKEQLFFINYANWWCGKSTKETAVRRIYTDPHAPKFARILGTMANSADFREAFNCPSKKPTCELW